MWLPDPSERVYDLMVLDAEKIELRSWAPDCTCIV
jgi:hypothetical protein